MPDQGVSLTRPTRIPDVPTRAERCEAAIDMIIAVMAYTAPVGGVKSVLIDSSLWDTIVSQIARVSGVEVKRE